MEATMAIKRDDYTDLPCGCREYHNEMPTRLCRYHEGFNDGFEERRAENARLREALNSIASNKCCDKCQEAALVARAALREGGDDGD